MEVRRNLIFFMELGGSLKKWDDSGILKREITLYNLLSDDFEKIYIVTYGGNEELSYKPLLKNNMEILHRKLSSDSPISNFLYELFIPFKYRRIFKGPSIYKTNQNLGSLAPVLAKILYPSNKLVVRSGYIGSLNAKLSKAPVHIRVYLSIAETISYFFCNIALIPEEHNRSILVGKYPFLKEKAIIHNNQIDTEQFKQVEKKKKYDIIYVARLDKDKNHRLLIDAIKNLDYKVLFVGNGKEEDEIIRLVTPMQGRANLIQRIANDKLPEYLNTSAICVFPSLHEGNPKALLEAMACELPVIALDVIGVRNIIKNEVTGILLPKDSPSETLAKSISELIRNNSRSVLLGKAAREFVVENYSLKKIYRKELELYKNL